MTAAATQDVVTPTTPETEQRGVFACSEWLGDVRFCVILADPPWDYGCKSPTAENFKTREIKSNKTCSQQYESNTELLANGNA